MFGFGKKKEILQNGVSAKAVFINVQQTGMYINNQPQVAMTLQVMP